MSEHVRTVFRTAIVAATPLPYFETIAQSLDLNTVPSLWCTLEFPLVTSTRTTIGYPACFREGGTVLLRVLARSGRGDTEAIHAAELLREFFDQPYIDDVRMLATSPPALAPVDNGEWIDVIVAVDYEWDYTVPASLAKTRRMQSEGVMP